MAKKNIQKSRKTNSASKRKSNSIFSKLNFNSKKTQLITVLLAFTLIGGSIMTYRSFAATSDYVFKPNAFNAKDYTYTETQGKKSGADFMYFSTGSQTAISVHKKITESGFYQVCLVSRSDRTGSSMSVTIFDTRSVMTKFGSHSSGTINIINSKEYSSRCEVNHVYLEAGKSYKLHVSRNKGSHIRVAYAVIQRVTTNQPSSK